MSATTMEHARELTLDEVAERLRISSYTVRRRILEGKLKARKEGREYRVREHDLETYLRNTEFKPEEK